MMFIAFLDSGFSGSLSYDFDPYNPDSLKDILSVEECKFFTLQKFCTLVNTKQLKDGFVMHLTHEQASKAIKTRNINQ